MGEKCGYKTPTPADSLEQQIIDPMFPKNEREWWASEEITRLRAEVEALKAENAALASWQCLFTDGTTGLYHDGCGNAQCARDHLVVHLTAEVEALRADNKHLRGEFEKAWPDAERYRWLRNKAGRGAAGSIFDNFNGSAVDECIDAAMAQGKV